MTSLTRIASRAAACVIVASALVAGRMTSVAHATPFPYVNDFSSTGLTNMAAEFTLDTGNGVLNYVSGGGTIASIASEQITGIGTSDFVVSTRFTLNNLEGSGTAITVGFGVLSASADLVSGSGPYYLCDWALGGGGSATLRILNQGTTTGTFSAVNANPNPGKAVAGETYEMRFTGTYTGGTLDMSLAVFDGGGNQIGAAATATHDSPFTGEYFGYRNRTAGANHAINASFDNFSVVVPEPSSVALALAGIVGLMGLGRKSRRRFV